MSLPIIILVERHWDVAPKQALMNALPFLNTLGYHTLCFESPHELNEQETIARVESTIQFIEKRLTETNKYLTTQGKCVDFDAMDFSRLQHFLLNFVTTRYSNEMALWFKELPGHKEKLNLIRTAIRNNMRICGVDLTSEQLQPIDSFEAQNNLHSRVSGIKQLDKARVSTFKNHLLELQQLENGIIFSVGQSHYSSLIEEFSREYYLGEVVFLHPYSLQCLTESHIDYYLPLFDDPNLTLIEMAINCNQDMEMFAATLKRKIQTKLNTHTPIEQTYSCHMLSDKTGLDFAPYVRPSFLVDCHHFFHSREEITATHNKLKRSGISGFFTFFRDKESYCIPCVNTQEMQSKIKALKL